MVRVRVITETVFDPEIEAYNFKISQDFSDIDEIQDMVERQEIPSPNILVSFLPNASNTLINAIRNDPNYGDGCILLTGNDEAQVPSQSEFDAIRDFLLDKLTEDPPSISQVDDAIGTTPNNRTRWEISQTLINWVKNL